jgi:hypothetical protein
VPPPETATANVLLTVVRGQGLARHDCAIVLEALRRMAGGTQATRAPGPQC